MYSSILARIKTPEEVVQAVLCKTFSQAVLELRTRGENHSFWVVRFLVSLQRKRIPLVLGSKVSFELSLKKTDFYTSRSGQ